MLYYATILGKLQDVKQALKEELAPYVDSTQVGNTNLSRISTEQMKVPDEIKNMFSELKKNESVKKVYRRCSEVYEKLSINWDGSVSACCGDYDNLMVVGNLNESAVRDIFQNSQELKQYRKMLDENKHELLPLCKTCFQHLKV